MTRALAWSLNLYRNLLYLCPAEVRNQFGPEMTLVFEDALRDAWMDDGLWGVTVVWYCAVVELLLAGVSNACAAPGVAAALISLAGSAFCFGGELSLARAHAPASTSTTALAGAVWTFVVLPSLTAAAVSFTAVRAGIHVAPLRLADSVGSQTVPMDRS